VGTVYGTPEREAIDLAFIELGVDYAEYLAAGGTAFTSTIVKSGGGRSQSLHDNLLGNINRDAAAARDLFDELDGQISGGARVFLDRPYYDGNLDASTADAAKSFTFDVLNGVVRADVNVATFQSIWTPLDADYGQTVNGNAITNVAFAHLGAAYARYLENGGSSAAFSSIQVKGPVDAGDDGNGRYQTLHDNLLGNISGVAAGDRGTTTLITQLLGSTQANEYFSRAYYSGDASEFQQQAHDLVRVFDFERGYVRNDYVSTILNGTLSETAQKPNTTDLIVGTGIPATGFNIVKHDGYGVELGLGVIYRQGPTEIATLENGVPVFRVAGGTQSTANGSFQNDPTRAAWNFNFSAVDNENGSTKNLTFKLSVDLDPGEGTRFATFDLTSAGNVAQDSTNYAFLQSLFDDPSTPAVETYAYGAGTFDIKLEAFDGGTLAAANRIIVEVA
jgi:hypothetical protein